MKQSVYSIQITNMDSMKKLEEFIGLLLKGENNQCSFVRSQDFVSMRLHALYRDAPTKPIVVYGENLKIVLDSQKIATVYTMYQNLDDETIANSIDPSFIGKRSVPESDDSDSTCCKRSVPDCQNLHHPNLHPTENDS